MTRKFRIFHSEQKRIIYLACQMNDTSICFNEWGWEALDHFSGKWETLAKEGDGSNLMESIGKIDINNVPIFEGDYIKIESGFLNTGLFYEVAWNKENCCYGLMKSDVFVKMLDKLTLASLSANDIIVVGNIYNDLESLKRIREHVKLIKNDRI